MDEKWIWHKKLGHAHMRLISEISKKELVKGLPKLALTMTQPVSSTKGVNKPRVCSTVRM